MKLSTHQVHIVCDLDGGWFGAAAYCPFAGRFYHILHNWKWGLNSTNIFLWSSNSTLFSMLKFVMSCQMIFSIKSHVANVTFKFISFVDISPMGTQRTFRKCTKFTIIAFVSHWFYKKHFIQKKWYYNSAPWSEASNINNAFASSWVKTISSFFWWKISFAFRLSKTDVSTRGVSVELSSQLICLHVFWWFSMMYYLKSLK